MSFNIFFRPDVTMVKWLADYADGRVIIDVGCGSQMHLLNMLQGVGYNKILGIDPNIDYSAYMKQRLLRGHKEMIQLLPKPVEECESFITGLGDKGLLVFARPCHSDFVENALDMKLPETEALYISVPENIDQYNDLGKYKEQAEIIEHKGTSEDNEKVWKII